MEIRETDYVYGWWAVHADDETELLVCLMRRKKWNILFHMRSTDPGKPGIFRWIMRPEEPHTPVEFIHDTIEDAIHEIFAVNESRRQVFVFVDKTIPLYRVIFHDDNKTSFQFVEWACMTIFQKTPQDAHKITNPLRDTTATHSR